MSTPRSFLRNVAATKTQSAIYDEVLRALRSGEFRALRMREDVTQEQVARAVGVSNVGTVSKWEAGLCFPTAVYTKALADILIAWRAHAYPVKRRPQQNA
jgi:DNA-binding transcriptional regulator YiaG